MNNFVLNKLVYTNFKINVRLEEILSLVNFIFNMYGMMLLYIDEIQLFIIVHVLNYYKQ